MQLLRICALVLLLTLVVSTAGCSEDFYLSEKEVRAYTRVLVTDATADWYFDNLQGRTITLQFDNSTGVPRLQSSNLLAEMRRTEMAQLETGPAAVSLDRLRQELETQIGNWASGRLDLYTSDANDLARLTRLDSVSLRFQSNPTFTYDSQRQSVDFDVRMTIIINGTIEVNAVSWLVNLFTGINGTYPLQIVVNDMRLQGEANLMPMYANAGQIDFRLVPQILGTIDVNDTTTSIPSQVKTGIQTVLSHNLAVHADQVFTQDYDYFALTGIRLSPDTPSRLSVCYQPKATDRGPAESTNPLLHLVTRAADGQLYHARKGSSGWSAYTALPRPSPSPSATPYPRIDNDPALVHSGGNQLELAATDAVGNVVYAHWRDEQWLNWWTIKPNINFSPAISYRGKPAVVASAPGQVEIVVAGSNGTLWHLRRYDGFWQTPVQLPLAQGLGTTYPLHDPSATIMGNEFVVSYLDNGNRLYAQAYDMASNTWGSANKLPTQETIPYAPTVVTFSDDVTAQVIVVYAGQSGAAYTTPLDLTAPVPAPSLSFGAETTIGGTLNAPPVVVALANNTLDVIGRWTDNRLRHNHYFKSLAPVSVDGRTVNPGWQGWQPLTDNLVGSPVYTDGRMAEFALAVTPTGRVELASRVIPSPGSVPSSLYHNSYESDRFASAPWKTVQWRGYEQAGSQQAVGRPALVAVDQNFQVGFESTIAFSSPEWRLNFARLSASDMTSFTKGSKVRQSLAPINPIVLATGIGITDYIYLGDDSRLHHDRWRSHGGGNIYTVNFPVGVSLASQLAADSYGNGAIELAAKGTDNRIYHWRFSDGSWSAPVVVASSMASAPILLHVGAAHLELLAVDFDHKVCRWRFNGTSWSARIPVSSTFRVNENLFRQSSASSWGDGTVDLVVVSLDTKELYHRRIGPDDEVCTMPIGCPAPRTFNKIGGAVIDVPVLTAFSPEKMNVLFLQSSLSWFSSWSYLALSQPVTFPPKRDFVLVWTPFQDMGAKEMVIGATANSGPRNYVAVAVDFNGHLLLNRISDGGWTGFQPISGQTSEMVLPSPVILPTIAAHGG